MFSRNGHAGSVFEALEERSLLDAHLAASLGAPTIGRDGRISVVTTITNTGDSVYRGGDSVEFFLTAENSNDPYSRNGLGIERELGLKRLPMIAAHARTRFTFTFDKPAVHLAYPGTPASYGFGSTASLAAGGYYVNTDLDRSKVVTDTTRALRAASPVELTIDGRFGNVGGHNQVLLVGFGQSQPNSYPYGYYSYYPFLTPTDSFAKLRIDGPGWGDISFDAASHHFVVTLHGTGSRSTLTFLPNARASTTSIANLAINGSVGTLRFDNTVLGGDVQINDSALVIALSKARPGYRDPQSAASLNFTVNGKVNDLRLYDLAGANIILNGPGTSAIHARTLDTVSIDSRVGLQTLEVKSWRQSYHDQSLRAPWIGRLSSAGDFFPDVTLTGQSAPRAGSLASADIKGAMHGAWLITGNVGTVALSTLDRLNIRGDLNSLRISNDTSGTLAARNIGKLEFKGNVSTMVIMAGADLGANGFLGTNGPATEDSFGGGTIGSFEAAKDFSGFVLAGVNPHTDGGYFTFIGAANNFLPNGEFVPGGPSRIGKITIRGRANNYTGRPMFVAESLPATASIHAMAVTTAQSDLFKSSF